MQSPQRDHLNSADPQLAECARWFQALDAAVAQSGVGDIGSRRVTGFPYLRIDRLLVSLKGAAQADARVHEAWVDVVGVGNFALCLFGLLLAVLRLVFCHQLSQLIKAKTPLLLDIY